MKTLNMKHVKLFEQFTSSGSGMNPVIVAKGDWTGIIEDPKPGEDYGNLQPATYIVEYITMPTSKDIPDGSYNPVYDDLEDITMDILGGDQNGHVLAPKNYQNSSSPKGSLALSDELSGIVRMNISPSISPEEIEAALQEGIDQMALAVYDEEGDLAEDVFSDPTLQSQYTSEFLSHLKMVMTGKPTSMKRKLIFNIR
jgi:hypothetical protein